jgi:hypothetical protein
MILTLGRRTAAVKENKLSKTGSEFVNFLVLKQFQKCHVMEVTGARKTAVLSRKVVGSITDEVI